MAEFGVVDMAEVMICEALTETSKLLSPTVTIPSITSTKLSH